MVIFSAVLSLFLKECAIWSHLFLKNRSVYKTGKHRQKEIQIWVADILDSNLPTKL